MRLITTAVALAVLIAAAITASADADIAGVVASAKPAVVTVITYDAAGKQTGLGTGFFVDASHVVTCYHVIDGATKAKIKTATGKTYQVKGIAASDRVADVVRLALASPVKGAKSFSLSKSLPKQGEKVVVFGSPLGLELTVSDGIVSAIRELPGVGKIIQITAPISPGSSGSPVLNLKGEVVGVVTSYLAEGQNLNFAVASEQVLSLKSSSSALPGAPSSSTEDKMWKEIRAGFAYAEGGDCAKALPHFETANRLGPHVAATWFGMGFCYDTLDRDLDAVDAYKQAIRIRPDDEPVHACLGVLYCDLHRYSDAVDSFEQAIRIKPDDAVVHFGLGLANDKLGRYQEAVDAYRQAIQAKSDYVEAHCNLGLLYYELGRYSDAADVLKQAIRIKPDLETAYFGLGLANDKLRRYQEAVDAYKQAIRISPDDAQAHFGLGGAYHGLHRELDAVDAFKQAIRIKPDYAAAHFLLGLTYLFIGDKGSALDEYKILKPLDAKGANDLFNAIYK